MKKNLLIGIIIASIVLLVGGVLFGLNLSTSNKDKNVLTPSTNISSTIAITNLQNSNMVVIKDYSFISPKLTVKKGTTIKWTNQDQAKHTVTGDNGGPNSQLIGQGESYSYTFDNIGTYNYHCEPHPYMKGIIEVTQ